MAATVPQGKTHVRFWRLLANGVDLSGDMRSIGEMGVMYDDSEITAWSSPVKEYMRGPADIRLTGVNVLFNNNAAATGTTPVQDGAHTALATSAERYVSVFCGVRAAPSIGVPTFHGAFQDVQYVATGELNAAIGASLQLRASSTTAQNERVWGVALAVGDALSASGQQASVDNGASSSGGYVALLHVTQTSAAMSSNGWVFRIEHSTDDSNWATLATFAADGKSITCERLAGTATVNRYVRFAYTRSAGTARPWVSFVRL